MAVIWVAFFTCIWAWTPICVNGATDKKDVSALNVLFMSMDRPRQLRGWTDKGGDPCGESWQGITCSGSSVITIKLTGLGLYGNLGYYMNTMRSLTELDLSNNSLGGGGTLQYNPTPNVKRINLANNQFGGNLPISFGYLASLEYLNLANNQFRGNLPITFALLVKLKYLNLAHNQLQGNLRDMFGLLTCLVTLDLSFNSFNSHLPPSFSSLKSLSTLYLQNNQFTGHIDVLAYLPLHTLNIANNSFTGGIPDTLKTMSNLKSDGNSGNSGSAPPQPSNRPPGSNSSDHAALVVGLAVGGAGLALTVLCLILLRIHRKKLLEEECVRVLQGMDVKPDIFSYSEMRTATDAFSSSNILGEGGYGPVFKGTLSDGRTVAVKRLSVTSHQGKQQFLTEIAAISAVRHRNLVKLYGCCFEGNKRILVYEFLENKSLDQTIFGKGKLHIDWPKRFEICLGVARGLAYLHGEASVRIVHRDIKASNVLLDADLNPKISDFGMAKLCDEKKSHVSTKVAGTIGYLAPEYAMRGHVTDKVDVYAFGILSLEILTGRPNSDQRLETEKIYLLEWAWYLHENQRELELVDGSMLSFDEDEVVRVIGVALLCTQASPAQRPPMSRVVAMLAGDVQVPKVTTKPSYLADCQNYKNSNSGASSGTTVTTPSAAESVMNSFLRQGR